MENNTDSINLTYTSEEVVISSDTIEIFENSVTNIPIANSTNSTNFITGVLWDSDDDTGTNGFDKTDKEDIVFVTRSNTDVKGQYGTYDFEIRVPALLRSYKGTTNTVGFYVELK